MDRMLDPHEAHETQNRAAALSEEEANLSGNLAMGGREDTLL
jgi:hypothetical protein